MKESFVRLCPREQQITDLLLQGCDNPGIARQLKMKHRTVKAHFIRLFLRFGIRYGIKWVKLATLLYRRQLYLPVNASASPLGENAASSDLSLRGWNRLLDPGVLALLIPVLCVVYWIVASITKHRERMAMIEKGIHPDSGKDSGD